MTRHPSTLAEPTGYFDDALFGADGTADPVSPIPQGDRFADPLTAVIADNPPRVTVPAVSQPVAPPLIEAGIGWDEVPAPVVAPARPSPSRAALAAPGLAPRPARGTSPDRVAGINVGRMPLRYSAPSYSRQPVRQPAFPSARPAPTRTRKSSGGWVLGLIVILFLLISGAGRQLLDAVLEILNR